MIQHNKTSGKGSHTQQHWLEAHSNVTPGVHVAVNVDASQLIPFGQHPITLLKLTQLYLGGALISLIREINHKTYP